jgi:hypothetical protein
MEEDHFSDAGLLYIMMIPNECLKVEIADRAACEASELQMCPAPFAIWNRNLFSMDRPDDEGVNAVARESFWFTADIGIRCCPSIKKPYLAKS